MNVDLDEWIDHDIHDRHYTGWCDANNFSPRDPDALYRYSDVVLEGKYSKFAVECIEENLMDRHDIREDWEYT